MRFHGRNEVISGFRRIFWNHLPIAVNRGRQYTAEIVAILRKSDIALCISDHHHAPAPWIATASFVYLRGHGPGETYHRNHPDAELRQWTGQIATWRKQRREVFVYFDNDKKAQPRRMHCSCAAMLKRAGIRADAA